MPPALGREPGELVLALAPAPGCEPDGDRTLTFAQLQELPRALRLTRQGLQLPTELLAHIAEAGQIVAGLGNAGFGFPAPLAIARDPRGLLDQRAQLFRTRFDQAADHALLDDGVAARAETRAEEQVGDIAPAAAGVVEEVLRLAVAAQHPAHHDLAIAPPRPVEPTGAVVEMQFDAGLGDGRAAARAVEDDIGHGVAAQMARGALPHHPAHGIDQVGLAATVGPDDADPVAGNGDQSRFDEGFESGQPDGSQTHGTIGTSERLAIDGI